MASESLFEVEIEGWEYTTLGDISARGNGGVQTGPFGSQLHASDYVTTGIPSIMPQNIGDNRIVRDGIARITTEDAERLSRYRVQEGDIIYSRRGDVERRALVRKEEEGWLCGTGCLRVRFDHNDVVPAFASFYLGDPRVRSWIVRHAHGATMPNLNTGILSALPFVVPPPNEQRAIAEVLSNLDDKIELNRRMNETLEAMARALFKSWFVDFDPVRAKAEGRNTGLPEAIAALFPRGFQDSEFGQIPMGWSIESIGNLCNRVSMGPFGSNIKTDNFVNEGVPVIRGKNLKAGFIDSDFVYISNEKADELRHANAFAGDIVITHRGTLGQVGLIPANSRFRRYVVSQSQLVLTANPDRVESSFLYHHLISPTGQDQLLSNTSQTGVPAISSPTTSVKSIKILLPSKIEVLQAFESQVKVSIARVSCGVAENRALVDLRDALLPKLISGEIRLGQEEERV